MIALEQIARARQAIEGTVARTPLVRLDAPGEIQLKLENLQPIGSFKLRGAYNAITAASPEERGSRLVTVSAGNMAQGVAWTARKLGLAATIVVPEHAPATKLAAIERLGGEVVKVTAERWFRALADSSYEGIDGFFVHPVQDELVMAGNGTIGLELLDDLPRLEAVFVPVGGGGLVAGIASALRATRPGVRVYAVEPETAAPLAASLAEGEPREADYSPSFVDGAGARTVLPRMWPLLHELVDEAVTVSLAEVAAAIRLLAERNRVVAEGAGALAVAAASKLAGGRKVAAVVSGGNIDSAVLCRILAGETP